MSVMGGPRVCDEKGRGRIGAVSEILEAVGTESPSKTEGWGTRPLGFICRGLGSTLANAADNFRLRVKREPGGFSSASSSQTCRPSKYLISSSFWLRLYLAPRRPLSCRYLPRCTPTPDAAHDPRDTALRPRGVQARSRTVPQPRTFGGCGSLRHLIVPCRPRDCDRDHGNGNQNNRAYKK